MKKNNKKFTAIVVISSLLVVMFSLTGPTVYQAATTPSLGTAGTFGVLATTFTRNGAVTVITGDLGLTGAASGSGSHSVSGVTYTADATYNQAGIDQGLTLTALSSQPCTHTFPDTAIDLATDTTHGPIGVYTPGVYCTQATRAGSIGTAGITLNGAGTYIFRINGALTTVDNSDVTLANGASSCDVFWTPTAATTLGANTTFIGTDIDDSGITVGANTVWTGRALAFAETVTTDTATINSTCTIAAATPPFSPNWNSVTVIKQVINDNGGTANFVDFPLFINGNPVSSGQSVSLPPGTYTISETTRAGYSRTFTGHCDANGQVNHGGVNTFNSICTVVNDDIGAPSVAPIPPLIDVVKVPSPLALPAGPGSVTYTYTLDNIGTVPVTNLTLVGDTCSPIILASGDSNEDSRLDINETWTYLCNTTLGETHTNTVVATGYANGFTAVDAASATVVVGLPVVPPLIHVTKIPNPLTLPAGAGLVTYTKQVTNPGTVALSNVNVTDDKCSPVIYISGDSNNNSMLDTNESWNYTCQTNISQTTTNTAIATGMANGLVATDFALATVVVAVPGFPNTGLLLGIPWNVAILAGFLILVCVSLVFLLKKHAV